MKKILTLITLYITIGYSRVFAGEPPTINCKGLPFCDSFDSKNPTAPDISESYTMIGFIAKITVELIQFTAVIGVGGVMITGIMLALSGGDEEKAKNAKTYFIWSLTGTLLSSTAYIIINLVNKIDINA